MGVVAGKPSVKSACPQGQVAHVRPEAKRAYPDQDEVHGNVDGGPYWLVVQNLRMNWGKK